MAETTNIVAEPGVWTLIATDPNSLTIKSNKNSSWQLAITSQGPPAEGIFGEIHAGWESWESGQIKGEVYIRPRVRHRFAVTM